MIIKNRAFFAHWNNRWKRPIAAYTIQCSHIFILIGFLFVLSFADFDSLRSSLQPLTSNFVSDSLEVHNKIVADSAIFITPEIRSVLKESDCPIEIKPDSEVDSILIFVKHSKNTIDTIGTVSHPPYIANWHYRDVPDQDQMHLQFGYVLYLQSGVEIVSPPLPHRWVINRNETSSKKNFHSKQTTTPEKFEIDGDIHEWNRIRKTALNKKSYASIVWTIGKMYLAVKIHDNSITPGDVIEFHFDMHNDKSNFAGINHRSIRFGPYSRDIFFTVELTDSGFTPADSVTMLLNEHTEWRTRITDDGYTLEAAIPHFCLSDLTYPSMKAGFDISVIDIDDASSDTVFFSWAGNKSMYARYNPSQWGTLSLHQAMLPLTLTMIVSAVFFTIVILSITIWLIHYYLKEKQSEIDTIYSESMTRILSCIKENISCTDLSIQYISTKTGIDQDNIRNLIQSEADCTFEYFVLKERIAQAKIYLAQKEYILSYIINSVGFTTLSEFENSFKLITGTTPEIYHKRKTIESEEDEDSR